MTPPSKDLAEMVVLTDVELHQVPYHPDYADPSSFMYKSMESTLISTVDSIYNASFVDKNYMGCEVKSMSRHGLGVLITYGQFFHKRTMAMPNNDTMTMSKMVVYNVTTSRLPSLNAVLGLNVTYKDIHTREEGMESSTCSFESSDENCFIRNSSDTWTRRNSSVDSHDYGSFSAYSGEYYMFTTAPTNLNFTMFLNTTRCLSFYYHMNGSSSSYLRIYDYYFGYIWIRSGDHGSRWYRGEVEISPLGQRLVCV